MILEDKIKNENGHQNKDHLKNLDKLKNKDQPKYVFNIHNLRLSGIANLELYIAQPNNYFFYAMERFCSIPAGSHSNGAFCIKSNFLPIF